MTDIDKSHTPSITCPQCHRTSYSTDDIENRYCGACRDYTSDPQAMVAKASRMYMTDAEMHHHIEVADRMVDSCSPDGRSSNRSDRMEVIVAALAMVLGGWGHPNHDEFRKAQVDARVYGDGFLRVKADGTCEVIPPPNVTLHGES